MKNKIHKLIIIIILFQTIISPRKYKKISDICQTDASQFIELKTKETIKWNVIEEVKNHGILIGKGQESNVYEINNPFFDPNFEPTSENKSKSWKKIAVKQIYRNTLPETINELEMIEEFSGSEHTPYFFGCHFDLKNDKIYLVQQKLRFNLKSEEFKKIFSKLMIYEKLRMYRQIFESIRFFWNKGYLHNNINPEDIMFPDLEDMQKEVRPIFIDFEKSLGTKEKLLRKGTFPWISPGKNFDDLPIPRPIDEIYSAALVILYLENGSSTDRIFEGSALAENEDVNCFNDRQEYCQLIIKRNGISLLMKRGYGQSRTTYNRNLSETARFVYTPSGQMVDSGNLNTVLKNKDKSQINFTDLIGLILDYHDFDYTINDVIELIDVFYRVCRPDPNDSMIKKYREYAII